MPACLSIRGRWGGAIGGQIHHRLTARHSTEGFLHDVPAIAFGSTGISFPSRENTAHPDSYQDDAAIEPYFNLLGFSCNVVVQDLPRSPGAIPYLALARAGPASCSFTLSSFDMSHSPTYAKREDRQDASSSTASGGASPGSWRNGWVSRTDKMMWGSGFLSSLPVD